MKKNRRMNAFLPNAAAPLRAAVLVAAALGALALPLPAVATSVALDPTLPGRYAPGTGANAVFHRIDGDWTGTSVHWNETLRQYGNAAGDGYRRIGEFGWGTGIWGLADWTAINAPGSSLPMQTWSGVVDTINRGDLEYTSGMYPNTAGAWGAADALPGALFDGVAGAQDNWTAHFDGYVRITAPGEYNFGVLYDDGFFLRIWGAEGPPVEIASDFLSARDRLGFDHDLALGTGLYRFELGTYDRLEVGVVNLSWRQGGGEWLTVPTAALVIDPIAIAAPGTAAAALLGLGLLAASRARRGGARTPGAGSEIRV